MYGEEFIHPIAKLNPNNLKNLFEISDNFSQFESDSLKIYNTKPAFRLYPSPNDGSMLLDYFLPAEQNGDFIIYDIAGNKIASYPLEAGTHVLKITELKVNNGVYLYKVFINNKIFEINKVIIID